MILGSVSLEASDSVAGAYVFLELTFWIAQRGRWTDLDSAIGLLCLTLYACHVFKRDTC